MTEKKSDRLIAFLLRTDDETNEEVREYLETVGNKPDEMIKTALKALKKRKAERKKESGRKMVEKFNEAIKKTKDEIINNSVITIDGAFAFKNLEKTNDENIKMLEEDNKKLEILKRVRDDI